MWTPNKNNVWSLSLAVLNPRVCYEYDGHVRKLLFSTTNGMFKHGNLGHFSHFPLNTCPLYLVSWVGRPTRSYFPQETVFFPFLKTFFSVLLWQLFLEVALQVSRSRAPCPDLEPWRTQLTLSWLLGESSVKWWSPIWFSAKLISGSEGARPVVLTQVTVGVERGSNTGWCLSQGSRWDLWNWIPPGNLFLVWEGGGCDLRILLFSGIWKYRVEKGFCVCSLNYWSNSLCSRVLSWCQWTFCSL